MDIIDFWRAAGRYAWHDELPQLLVLAAGLSMVLLYFRPDDRKAVASTLAFFLSSLLGAFAAGMVQALGLDGLGRGLREAFIIAEGMALVRLGGFFIFRLLLPLFHLKPVRIIEDIADFIGYCAWLMLRLHYAGVELSGIVTTSAVMTAVLAFAMQDTLGNILGGLALQLDNSIGIGDWIKVDDVVGKVVEIRWRYTAIETRNWETVVIPNSSLMKGKFAVLGRRKHHPQQWRRWIWFNVGYETPPGRVVDTVQKAVRESNLANVALQPQPSCVAMDFDACTVRYALRYWLTDLAQDDPTDSEVRKHVYAAMQRAGIRFAFPEYHVHMTKEGEKHEQTKHARQREERLQALHGVELFNTLTEDELAMIADRLKYAPFAKGDVITHQGAMAHWLYILVDGQADVFLELPDGTRRQVGSVAPGGFFGEMGLMAGAPRSATVMAKTDAMCYRLDKESFQTVLHNRPELAEEISRVLVHRRFALDHFQQEADAEANSRHLLQQHNSLVARIRGFFGLETED